MHYDTVVSPLLGMWGLLYKKDFHERTNFLGKFMGWVVLHGKTNDQIMSRRGESFTNVFASNLNTVNLKIFSKHGGIYI